MKGRLSVNMMANMAAFFISMVVSIWLTPFIINSLGAEAYGFIPLTQQLISYMTVITIALSSMSGRFFTFAYKSGDNNSAEEYFNTTIIASLILSFFISIILIFITVYINRIVTVPSNLMFDVRISLIVYGVIFIISLLGSCFGIAMFCEDRLDINGVLSSINTIIRSILIITLLTINSPRMWFVSLGTLLAAVMLFVQNIYYFKKLLPNIKIDLNRFSAIKLKEILSTGIWSSINYVGAVLFLQIDLLVANWALGARGAGEYSAVLQLSNLFRGFVSSITIVFAPTMVILYAKQNMQELVKYSNKSVKITGLLLGLPIGLACGLGESILTLWLGASFKDYGALFFLMTIHLSINLSVQPLFGVFSATKNVKVPAIVTLIMGLANFMLAIMLSIKFKMGAYGIVISAAIVLTMKNLIFTPIYSAKVTNQHFSSYYKGLLIPVIGVCLVAILSMVLHRVVDIKDVFQLFGTTLLISSIYCVGIYLFALNRGEKNKFKSAVCRRLNLRSIGGEG